MKGCELCGGDRFRVMATEIREGPGLILQCETCGLVLQDISQTGSELKRYYNEDYQRTNSLREGETQSPREHFNDTIGAIRPVFERIRPFLKKDMRVLEIGCGAGELLSLVKPLVAEAVGIELNEDFVRFIRSELGITAYAADVNRMDLPVGSFDLVLCIMTLDHLPNPVETLMTMRRLLRKGGILYLEVPNWEEALNTSLPEPSRTRYNTFFWHRAHYFYFTKETLMSMLRKAGFTPEISCRHQYTLVNFLNWYFLGTPQKTFIEATSRSHLFPGSSPFEERMNDLFNGAERQFQEILADTCTGDTLCCIARRTEVGKP
jgi:SAM-dependent methyltransferase